MGCRYVRYDFRVKIEGRDEWYNHNIRQPFGRKGSYNIKHDHWVELIWAWDGNRESPTLTPSFLYDARPAGKLHLFVKNGKLDILADTTVSHDTVVKL